MQKVSKKTWTEDGEKISIEKIIKFDDELKDPENTEVFVTLAGIEAKISNEGKKIRSYVYVTPKSITKNKFTVVVETWSTSNVYEVGIAWIAISK